MPSTRVDPFLPTAVLSNWKNMSKKTICECPTLPFWQFHVLFNSLFKVLFIFPSRYLFAIGLSPVFSFRWYLPPILVCIPKQTDSSIALYTDHQRNAMHGIVTLCDGLFQGTLTNLGGLPMRLETTILEPKSTRFPCWAVPASLAVTRGILVSFFSSA